MSPRTLAALAPAVLLAAGCSDRPKAPPLTNETVYQNDAIGLRFVTPSGWAIDSRAVPPPGELARPVILASYLKKAERGSEKPADLQVLAADLAPDADAVQFLATHRVGAESWRPAGPVAAVAINGAEATRFVLAAGKGKDESRREVTVFRRGGRAYFFAVAYFAADTPSRDVGRASVDSVTWSK